MWLLASVAVANVIFVADRPLFDRSELTYK